MPCLYIEHHGVAHKTPHSFHTCLHNPAACGLRVLRQAREMNGTSTIWVLITFGHRKWILIFVTAANLLGPISGRLEETRS